MILHKDKSLFYEVISRASNYFSIDEAIIEKDYYVTIFLKELASRNQNIVFKGGTSLSKCYHIINRFSEDIDLNYWNNKQKPSEKMRKELKNAIVSSAKMLNLKILVDDIDKIPYKRDFLEYPLKYESIFSSTSLRPELLVETSVRSPSYPVAKKEADSYVSKYLEENGYRDVIKDYDLEGFTVLTQSIERTFADKLFAIADYYLEDMQERDSRHLYDVRCLKPYISIDNSYIQFLNEIKELRKNQPNNPSARSNIPLTVLLQKAIDEEKFKNDYIKYTTPILYEDVSYDKCIDSLQTIINDIEAKRIEKDMTMQPQKEKKKYTSFEEIISSVHSGEEDEKTSKSIQHSKTDISGR